MEQTRIGEYIEEVITYPLYKKRKYTFRQMLEAEIKANEEIERHLEYMRSNPYARK
jgi:hypothetical protein